MGQMPSTGGSAQIDPEPFTVIVGIAGIVGGVASVAAMYKIYFPEAPMENRRLALEILDKAADHLRYLRTDIAVLQEVLAEAEIQPDRRFRLKTTAFLSKDQFRRYRTASEQAFDRLGQLLKSVNKLDPLLPRLPEVEVNIAASQIEDVQARLDRLLHDRELSVGAALDDLAAATSDVQGLIESLRRELRG